MILTKKMYIDKLGKFADRDPNSAYGYYGLIDFWYSRT